MKKRQLLLTKMTQVVYNNRHVKIYVLRKLEHIKSHTNATAHRKEGNINVRS